MKKIIYIFILLALMCAPVRAQYIEADLTEESFVSLLTMGPGEEFYTSWGHTAIRVCDSTIGLDMVYNYGTFDELQRWFYLRFARGSADYMLERDPFDFVLFAYAWEGRAVWEQRLDLTLQERQNLLILLEENNREEFRYYPYDFFRDNCATRVRDILSACLDHRRMFDTCEVANALTYRDIVHRDAGGQPWWVLGVDLLLGARCDRPLNNLEYQFSPLELMAQVDSSVLLGDKRQLLEDLRPERPYRPSPELCLWLLFVAVLSLTILGWAKGKRLMWLDEVLFWLVSLVSLFLIFMWFGTNHYCTKANWNLLWANPLFICLALYPRRPHKAVVLAELGLLLFALLGIFFLPQPLNPALVPLILALFIRVLDKLINKDNN